MPHDEDIFWKSSYDPAQVVSGYQDAINTAQAGVDKIREALLFLQTEDQEAPVEGTYTPLRGGIIEIPRGVHFGTPAEIWAKSASVSDIRRAGKDPHALGLTIATTSSLTGAWPTMAKVEEDSRYAYDVVLEGERAKIPSYPFPGRLSNYSTALEALTAWEDQYKSIPPSPDRVKENLWTLFDFAWNKPKEYLEAARQLSRSQKLKGDIPFVTSWKYLSYMFTWDELVKFAIHNHVKNKTELSREPYAHKGTFDAILPPTEDTTDPLGIAAAANLTEDEAKILHDWMAELTSGAEDVNDYSADDIAAVFRAQKRIYAEYADQWEHDNAPDEYPDASAYQEPMLEALQGRLEEWDSQKTPDQIDPVKDHELRIGLCKFRVPPTSIHVEEKFMQLISPVSGIRMSSNPKFSSGHSNTMISISLFFPDFESMWGVTYDEAILAGEALHGTRGITNTITKEGIELDKQASSLRGLIAAFKASPFLPIRNKYLNETYDIDAVTLLGMTISTSEAFPHAVEVNLQLLKFNYQLYLPHAADFNNCIMWGRYRYYLSRMMQRIDSYVSFSWLLNHANPVEIKVRNQDIEEGIGAGTEVGEVIGHRTYPWAEDDRSYALKDLELFYVSETVGPAKYPRVYVYDDLVYERAEAWMDEKIRNSRHTWWDGVLSGLFGTQVADFNKWGFEEILGDPSLKDPAIYGLIVSMLGAQADYSNVGIDVIEEVLEKHLTDIGYYNLPEEERPAVRETASLQVMQSALVYIATSWMRSDKYRTLMESALKDEGYASVYEWEVPMVPLYLDGDKVKVDAMAVSLSNNIANLQLQLQDEPTHQHVGSGDTHCQISLTIMGESELKKLSEMIDRVQALSRYERSSACLGFWGIKNVLTALAGMRYCLPVSMTYNSVPGQPHLYRVLLELVDFDIFQQNRETFSQREMETLIAEFGKMNPFLRLKQNARYFNCYPDLPLDIKRDGEHVGYLEPDFYYVASCQETMRWVDDEQGGLVSQDAHGEKSYVWPDVDVTLTGVSSADFDSDYVGNLYLTRLGGDNALKVGIKDVDLVAPSEEEEGGEESEGEATETTIEEINTAETESLSAEEISEIAPGDRTYIDYRGEAQSIMNPEMIAVNPYYEHDVGKNYDAMVENLVYSDARGRMIRAFPTYYLLLIDEGGYIFSYKMFDDFYGLTSVIDFSLHCSEDMVADTLVMRLANFYGKLSTPVTSGFNRLFGMASAWNTQLEETFLMARNLATKLTDQMGVPVILDGEIVWTALDHIEVKPGVRLQLRAGYSSNINMLPTLFNGVVTEVSAGDITTVTCQSDGVELLAIVNAGEKDGHSGCIDGAWFSGWDFSEPRDLIIELMTSGGSVYHQAVSAATKGAIMGDSRFGIRHFGCILWETNPDNYEADQETQRQDAVQKMLDEFRLFTEVRDKLSIEEQPGGLSNAITTMLIGEGSFSDQVKTAFGNMMTGKDTEIYKRNIYPGNATGIMEMVGVDSLQTTGAALGNLGNLLLGTGIGGGTLLAGGLTLIGHPWLAAGALLVGSVGGILGKTLIEGVRDMVPEEAQDAPGTGITEIIGLTDPDKSGPEDPFCEISMQLYTYQRTVWDLMKDCAALLPNYIVAVRPWEHRSTLFYGKPYWLYTSGVWPLTRGTNKAPTLREDITEFLEALMKERVQRGVFVETIDKYARGQGVTEQPPTGGGAAAISEAGFDTLTNYLAATSMEAVSQAMREYPLTGPDGQYPNYSDAILQSCANNGVNPIFFLAMAIKECGPDSYAKGKAAGYTGSAEKNFHGIKWSESRVAQYGGYKGGLSTEAGSYYMSFYSYEEGIEAAARHLRFYLDSFYKCKTDPNFDKDQGILFRPFWEASNGDVLLALVSRWSAPHYVDGTVPTMNTKYRDDIQTIMRQLENTCSSGISGESVPTTDRTPPPTELKFLSNKTETHEQIREEVENTGLGGGQKQIKAILTENPAPYYDSILANDPNKPGEIVNPWLDLWFNAPRWWADMDYREDKTYTVYADTPSGKAETPSRVSTDKGGDEVLFSLLFLMKYRKIAQTSAHGWGDDLNAIYRAMNENDLGGLVTHAGLSKAEIKELTFDRRAVAIANVKHDITWPSDEHQCMKLNDCKHLWEHLDVPCALDYLDVGIFNPDAHFIPRNSNVTSLAKGPNPHWNRIVTGVWGARSRWHRRSWHQYYDPELSTAITNVGSSEMRCDDDTAFNIFEDMFRYGEDILDNRTGGEFFGLWNATMQHGIQRCWARLLIDAWSVGVRRPKIVDLVQKRLDSNNLAGEKGSFLIGAKEGTNGGDWEKVRQLYRSLLMEKYHHKYLDRELAQRSVAAGIICDITFGLIRGNTHDRMDVALGQAENICKEIGANDDMSKILCFLGFIGQEASFFIRHQPFNSSETLERSVHMTWMAYRALESKINPEVFGLSKDQGVHLSDDKLISMVSAGLKNRVQDKEIEALKLALKTICVLAPIDTTEPEGFEELGGPLFALVQTVLLCTSPALFVPSHALSPLSATSSSELSGGGTYLPVYTFPIIWAEGSSDYSSLTPIPSNLWSKNLVQWFRETGDSKGAQNPANELHQRLNPNESVIREAAIFLEYSPRAIYREFLYKVINPNDWAIAWIATTSGKHGSDIQEGTADFGPLCEAFAFYLRNGMGVEATYKWMLEHQDIGDHELFGLFNALKGGIQNAFGFIEEVLKKLWGLALMGSGGFAAGISVARHMGNLSNLLNMAYNDSLYYMEGVADNPFTREFQEPVVEIREPFQKFWIIDSFSDIIDNSMICSSEGIYTVVTAVSGGGNPQTVFADRSIYPEWQREKVVETSLRWEEPKWWQMISGVLDSLKKEYLLDKGCPYDVQAKRVAANALKESLKDMYGGEITILGRPEIRPFDIVYICDLYENICGLIEVEAVTHHFSVETGFITAIKPNALVAVDDPGKWNFAVQIHAAGSIIEAHKRLKHVATSASHGKTARHTTTQGEQAEQELLGALKGGYLDWLYNLHHGVTPTYEEIVDSTMDPVSGGIVAATNSHGVTQTQVQLALDWFQNNNYIKVEKWNRYAEARAGGVPLIGKWVSNLFGGIANIFGWFRDNFIDYHPVSMFLLLKEGKPWAAGIDGHGGLVVGTPERKSLLPGVLGNLLSMPTGDFVKPHDVLGRLGYTKMDSINMIRSVNMFQAAAIARAETERGRLESGMLPIGMAPDVYKAWIVSEYRGYPKGCIDGDTFYCTTIGPGLTGEELTTALSRPGVLQVRLSLLDCREYHPAKDADGKWVANPHLGEWTDDLGIKHKNEIGGLECWEALMSLLPAPGKPIWLVVNPYNYMDSYGRVPALIYNGDDFATQADAAEADYTRSLNYALYMKMAPLGYAEWMYELPDTHYGPPGVEE